METVIKQAEEAKRGAVESARRAFEDYQPLKFDVDQVGSGNLCLVKNFLRDAYFYFRCAPSTWDLKSCPTL